jgi:hypothetical protein
MTDSNLLDAAAPIDRFRAHLLADPDLQQRLNRLADTDAFVVAMIAAAAEAGIAITPDEAHAALKSDPLGLWRVSGAAATDRAPPAGDWLPVAMVVGGGAFAVDWAHFAGRSLTDPFFEDSLRRTRTLPINRLTRVRTPLATLVESVGENPPVPAGFVFHLSRCGSTLVSQMLAADPRNIVVSEAAPIDAIVQLAASRADVPIEHRLALLRAMIGALGRNRTGADGHYVVKLDSWHTFALPLFRLAFPETPWVFLYREPVEILVSHSRMPGSQTVPGAMPFDPYGIENAANMLPDEFAARALGRTAAAVVEHIGLGGGLLVDYAELPAAVEARILPHFGIVPDEAARATLAAASARDAKTPTTSFTGDSETKRQEASAQLRGLAEAHMAEPHRLLQALRLAGEK